MNMNYSRITPLLALALILGLIMAHPAVAQKYTIADLGTLGGSKTFAYDINEQGEVVGESQLAGSGSKYDIPIHAFIWSGGKIADLGTLGGRRSYAYSINQAGQVVGYSYTLDNSNGGAFLWPEGTVMKNLGALPGGSVSMAYGISKDGQITGFSDTLSNAGVFDHAFLWKEGVMVDIGTLGGLYSYGMGINSSGQVVGYSENCDGSARAFLWGNGQMSDLGTLGGSDSYANRINNMGQVVGRSFTVGGESHAFFYEKNGMIDLGTLGGNESEARGINDIGGVVGTSTIIVNGSGRGHAFIWENGKGMRDLNQFIPADSGWELVVASGINNQGQIVGWGYVNGVEVERAFLLTPVEEPKAPEALKVKINIRPWSPHNKINPWAKWGLVPVAILSSPDFNASRIVERDSLTFGRTGDEDSLAFCLRWPSNVNHDRLKDLICYFHVGPMGFQCGDKEGVLKGKTMDGKKFEGADEIQIWPCHTEWKHHHEH